MIYAIALWYTEGRQVIGVLPEGFLELYTAAAARHADRRATTCSSLSAGAVDRRRVPADRALPLRHRRQPARGGAERHPDAAATSSAPSSPRASSARWPASCWRRSCASARRASGWSSCCRRWSARSSARPPSGPGGSTSGARSSASSSWRSASPASSSSAAQFYVEPLFNGVTLLIAIGIAGYAQRAAQVRHQRAAPSLRRAGARRADRSGRPKRLAGARTNQRDGRNDHVERLSMGRPGSRHASRCWRLPPRPPGRRRSPTPRPSSQGDRAEPALGRPDHGPEGAGRQDHRLRLDRPAQRRRARRRRGRQGGRRQDRLELHADRRPGLGLRPLRARSARPSRSKPDVHRPGRHRRHRAGRRDRGRGQAGHRDRRLALLRQARPAATSCRSSPTSPPTRCEVARAAASWPCAETDGKAGAVIFTNSTYEIAVAKSNAMAAVIKACGDCKVLEIEDTPLADASTRMPPLTTALLQRFGEAWTHALRHQRPDLRLHGPALASAGMTGDGNAARGLGRRRQRGRVPAHPRRASTRPAPSPSRCACRAGRSSTRSTGRSPGEKPSGYVAPAHLFMPSNIDSSMAGRRTPTTPTTTTSDAYAKIWGVSEAPPLSSHSGRCGERSDPGAIRIVRIRRDRWAPDLRPLHSGSRRGLVREGRDEPPS